MRCGKYHSRMQVHRGCQKWSSWCGGTNRADRRRSTCHSFEWHVCRLLVGCPQDPGEEPREYFVEEEAVLRREERRQMGTAGLRITPPVVFAHSPRLRETYASACAPNWCHPDGRRSSNCNRYCSAKPPSKVWCRAAYCPRGMGEG